MYIIKNITRYALGALLIVAAAYPTQIVQAQLFVLGGRSLVTLTCTCTSGCVLITVGPPRSGTFMYCPGVTQTHSWFNIFPPAWQIGNSWGYMACMQTAVIGCYQTGGGPVIQQHGTSMM